jgi:hypothetical protein
MGFSQNKNVNDNNDFFVFFYKKKKQVLVCWERLGTNLKTKHFILYK